MSGGSGLEEIMGSKGVRKGEQTLQLSAPAEIPDRRGLAWARMASVAPSLPRGWHWLPAACVLETDITHRRLR